MNTSRLQCTLCFFTTRDLHLFLTHPCAERRFERQKQGWVRNRSRYRLDDLLFCALCGCPRRKADEEKRRAGKMGGMHLGYQCWICQTPHDEDWSFLDRLHCLREYEAFWLACPHPQCREQLRVVRTDLVPVLSWFHGRRNGPLPSLRHPQLAGDCPTCAHSFAAQDMLRPEAPHKFDSGGSHEPLSASKRFCFHRSRGRSAGSRRGSL